jgi:uncharacterized FlaG/YvyC family protein
MASEQTRVRIEVHDESGRFVTKVIDEAGQVVRQYPAEEFLRASERLDELRGLLFEKEV